MVTDQRLFIALQSPTTTAAFPQQTTIFVGSILLQSEVLVMVMAQTDILESNNYCVVPVKDNGQPSLSTAIAVYLHISNNIAEAPEI